MVQEDEARSLQLLELLFPSYHVSFHHVAQRSRKSMATRGGEGQPEFLSFGALPRILSLSGHRRKVFRLQGGVDVQEPEPLWMPQSATTPIPCSGFLNQTLLPPARCPHLTWKEQWHPQALVTNQGFSPL